MQVSTINEVHYRPSEKAKKILLGIKDKFPKKSLSSIIDEAVIKLK